MSSEGGLDLGGLDDAVKLQILGLLQAASSGGSDGEEGCREEVEELVQELSLPRVKLHIMNDLEQRVGGLHLGHVRTLVERRFVVVDGFTEWAMVERARAQAEQMRADGMLQKAMMSRGAQKYRDETKRSDSIRWITNIEELQDTYPDVYSALREIRNVQQLLNDACSFQSTHSETQLAAYTEPAARYVRHMDAFRGGHAERRVTCLLYLNPCWSSEDGGCVRLFLPDGKDATRRLILQERSRTEDVEDPRDGSCLQSNASGEVFTDVAPLANRLLLFLSNEVEHEVLPTNSPRFALTTWFY